MMITKDMEIALKSDAVCLYLAADVCADKGTPSLHQELLRIRGNVLEAINERASLLERVKVLEAALRPFALIADMEKNAGPGSSVIVNVERCHDARSALKPEQEAAK